ncbi:MAG: hypothetical protein HYZ16_01410 [Bacteroidetes bacterium]|jgi:hypothetical protein|nr:hypothetical protein [Bacteroidota bacterium]
MNLSESIAELKKANPLGEPAVGSVMYYYNMLGHLPRRERIKKTAELWHKGLKQEEGK